VELQPELRVTRCRTETRPVQTIRTAVNAAAPAAACPASPHHSPVWEWRNSTPALTSGSSSRNGFVESTLPLPGPTATVTAL